MKPTTSTILVGIALAAGSMPAAAADAPSDCPRPPDAAMADMPSPTAMPSMKKDDMMPSAMARPGTQMMDVTRGAAMKDNCMQPMLNHEQGMMDGAKPAAKK